MKSLSAFGAFTLIGACIFSSCQQTEANEKYIEVIGEYEQPTPEAGYRLNLTYNGMLDQLEKFERWADSVQKHVPGMVKSNENMYVNYMPGEIYSRPKHETSQASVTYILTVSDSTLYNKLSKDLLNKSLSFSLNVMGAYLEPEQKSKLQQDLIQKALGNAEEKITFLNGGDKSYEIVEVEELDNTVPHGPEYYEFNRRMVARVKVKARLN